MNYMLYLLFSLAALSFTIIPGPNAALIIGTTLSHNTLRGLQAVCGINLGIAMQLVFALLGSKWLLAHGAGSQNWLVWSVSAITIYLLLRWLFARFRTGPKPHLSGALSFSRALGISLTNPKGLIFFAIVLPPFIDKTGNTQTQSSVLSLLFLFLSFCVDAAYVFFARTLSRLLYHSKFRKFLIKHKRLAKYRFRSWLKHI